MTDFLSDVRSILVRDVTGLEREVAALPDDDHLWKTMPGVTNPIGTLAFHIAGNLQHYVGAVLGRTGYVRHRDVEFSRRTGTRADALDELARARQVVESVIPTISADTLAAEYPERQFNAPLSTQRFLLHLCVHLGMHLGQAGYLRRALTGDERSMGPAGLKDLTKVLNEGA